jgi:hypothetical protein
MPLTDALLRDTLTDKLHRIRRDHKRLTGRELPWSAAVDELDRQTAERIGDALPNANLLPLRLFLVERGYDDHVIENLLADVRRDGTVWSSDNIDCEDVEEAERLIPVATGWPKTLPILK